MGKNAREDRRRAAREASTSGRKPPFGRRRIVWLAGAAAALTVVVGVLASLTALGIIAASGSGSGQVPAGTAVFTESNHQHVTGAVQYDRTPPAGGAHNAVWLNCGVYASPVPAVNAVHSLEHGAVWITYRPDLSAGALSQLRQFVESHYDGAQRYVVLSPYDGLPSPIVASAWGAQLQVTSASDPRLAAFVAHYQGGPQGGEPGGECTGGTGTPIA